jgi:L-alanine-DL-glutamate epimerase-like enolase superfamily enzyme
MIDAGDRWTPEQAIANIIELEKVFDLTCVDCKDAAWEVEELREVSDKISAAVCASGFAANNPHATDIVELNLLATGITGALQIADAAYGFELPVTLAASPGNVAAHLAGALPNFMSMEIPASAMSDASISDVVIEDGRASVGDRPGLGLAGVAE